MSVFSISYWVNKGLSEEEAKYQIAIRRPNNILYYINKGYSEEEAKNHVSERQSKGGIKRKKMSTEEKRKLSPRCIEFWVNKGLSFDEASEKLKEFQTHFNKKICIEKYGVDEGVHIWQERQHRWQETLKSKSPEEIKDINLRKNPWRNLSEEDSNKMKIQIGNKVREIVSKRSKNDTDKIFKKIIDSKIEKGQYMPRHLLPKFEQYKRLVWKETRKNDLSLLENFKERGRKKLHLDHMYSIWQGFLDNTPPEIVGHICNLKMIDYRENLSKHVSCSLSLKELNARISKY
jgi:hypothetical protein